MVPGPGESAFILRRRKAIIPKKQKFLTRKRKLLKQNLKVGIQERVKGHVAP
jgi:hypothetical protein